MNQTEIRKKLTDFFGMDEIRTLCFDLNIDHEQLPSQSKDAFVRELVIYCRRRGRLDDLIEYCRKTRPQIEWLSSENDESKDTLKIKSEQLDILSTLSDFLRLGGSNRMPKDELVRQFRNRTIEKELEMLERMGYVKETMERFGGQAYIYLTITEKGQEFLRTSSFHPGSKGHE